MARTLQRHREFGQIHPPYHGAMYVQNGEYFGGDEQFLFSEGEQPEEDAPERPQEAAETLFIRPKGVPVTEGVRPDLLAELAKLSSADQKALLRALTGSVPESEETKAAESEEQTDVPAVSRPSGPLPAPSRPGEVDLAAWARGEVNHPFFSVKRAAKEAVPGIIDTNTKTIAAGLVAHGLVAREDVRR